MRAAEQAAGRAKRSPLYNSVFSLSGPNENSCHRSSLVSNLPRRDCRRRTAGLALRASAQRQEPRRWRRNLHSNPGGGGVQRSGRCNDDHFGNRIGGASCGPARHCGRGGGRPHSFSSGKSDGRTAAGRLTARPACQNVPHAGSCRQGRHQSDAQHFSADQTSGGVSGIRPA